MCIAVYVLQLCNNFNKMYSFYSDEITVAVWRYVVRFDVYKTLF